MNYQTGVSNGLAIGIFYSEGVAMNTANNKFSQDLKNLTTEWILPVSEPSAPVIETHGLTKTYKGVEALKALDLQVQQNSICGFLGRTALGKPPPSSCYLACQGPRVVAEGIW